MRGDMVPLEGAPQQTGRLGFTLRVPLGVVCAITPFNAPLNTVAHKVAPALAAGNAVVLKPSTTHADGRLHDGRGLACRRLAAALAQRDPRRRRDRRLATRRAVASLLRVHRQHRGRRAEIQRSRRAAPQHKWSWAASCFTHRRRRRGPRTRAAPRSSVPRIARPARSASSIQLLLVQRSVLAAVQRRLIEMVARATLRRPAGCEDRRRPGRQRGRSPPHRTMDHRCSGAGRAACGRRRAGGAP